MEKGVGWVCVVWVWDGGGGVEDVGAVGLDCGCVVWS